MSAAPPAAVARSPRWIVSFADLCLLLLGFFVMLQAQNADRGALVAGVRAAFGDRHSGLALPRLDEPAAPLFQPGEALLREDARRRFAALGRDAARARRTVRIESIGIDRGGRRFDGWELAAARVAAVARAVRSGGLAEDRIIVAIPAIAPGDRPGQHIAITRR